MQGPAPGVAPNEVLAKLRDFSQRHFADFERGANEGIERLFAPQIGSLSTSIDEMLRKLQDLEIETQARQNIMRVPPAFQAELLQLVREELARPHPLLQLRGQGRARTCHRGFANKPRAPT